MNLKQVKGRKQYTWDQKSRTGEAEKPIKKLMKEKISKLYQQTFRRLTEKREKKHDEYQE